MKKIIIITGANKGLGKSFYDYFSNKEDCFVVSVSRRLAEDQQKFLDQGHGNFAFIQADFEVLRDTLPLKVLEEFKEQFDKVVFINNAGSVQPIGSVGKLNELELINSININVISPVIISNYILKIFEGKKIDILNISSGAAKNAVGGWAAYCGGKAYMHMFMQTLELQMKNNPEINIYSIDPGVIDTEMQQTIRQSKENAFLRQAEFIALKAEGKLLDANSVALRILTETNQLV